MRDLAAQGLRQFGAFALRLQQLLPLFDLLRDVHHGNHHAGDRALLVLGGHHGVVGIEQARLRVARVLHRLFQGLARLSRVAHLLQGCEPGGILPHL